MKIELTGMITEQPMLFLHEDNIRTGKNIFWLNKFDLIKRIILKLEIPTRAQYT